MARIDVFLRKAMELKASDFHLVAGSAPLYRIFGEIRSVKYRDFEPAEAKELLDEVLTSGERVRFEQSGRLDFVYLAPELGRFRVRATRQLRGVEAVFRMIADPPPALDDLRLPPAVKELAGARHGLVLVTGPALSGKTTTLSALVGHLARARSCLLVTLEEPIEFLHPASRAVVSQRQVGVHARSFAAGMRAAADEGAEIVAVSDLPAREDVAEALALAESGVLVLAALTTISPQSTIERLVDAFPPTQRTLARSLLADVLRGVVTQKLVRGASGNELVPAVAVLLGTAGAAMAVRDGRLHQLSSMMESGRAQGMRRLDDSLLELLHAGRISAEAACLAAETPRTFVPYLAREGARSPA